MAPTIFRCANRCSRFRHYPFFYNIALCPRGLSAFCVLLVAHDSAVAVGIVLDHQCTLCNGSSILFNELVVNFCIFNVLVSLLHGCTRHHWIHHPCAFFASLASSRCVLRIFGYVAIHLISSTSRCASLNSTDDLRSMSSFQGRPRRRLQLFLCFLFLLRCVLSSVLRTESQPRGGRTSQLCPIHDCVCPTRVSVCWVCRSLALSPRAVFTSLEVISAVM